MIKKLLDFKLRRKGYEFGEHASELGRMRYIRKSGRDGHPAIVLVHGIGTEANHFHEILPALSQRGFTVIAPDLPGHGKSSETTMPMTAQILYDAFAKGIDRIAPERFVLFGNSMGGALSMLYAARNPERVAGLMLASPAAGFASEEEWTSWSSILKVDDLNAAGVFLRRIFHKDPLYLPLLRRPFYEAFSRPGIRNLLSTLKFQDFLPPPDVTLYQGRTHLIWGRSERLFPRRNLETLRTLLAADAVIEEPDRIAHCPQLDQPRWFAERLASFARSIG